MLSKATLMHHRIQWYTVRAYHIPNKMFLRVLLYVHQAIKPASGRSSHPPGHHDYTVEYSAMTNRFVGDACDKFDKTQLIATTIVIFSVM